MVGLTFGRFFIGKGPVRLKLIGSFGMFGPAVGILLGILCIEKRGGIRFAKSEIKIDPFFQYQNLTGFKDGSLGQRSGFLIGDPLLPHIIGHIPAADVSFGRARVHNFDPVTASACIV